MSRPRLEVADIIRSAGADFIARNRSWLRWTHLKVLLAITRCRTAALGDNRQKLMTVSRDEFLTSGLLVIRYRTAIGSGRSRYVMLFVTTI